MVLISTQRADVDNSLAVRGRPVEQLEQAVSNLGATAGGAVLLPDDT